MIDPDVLWSCTTCGACVEQCPVDIEHIDHIVDMRRYQVMMESEFPSELSVLFKNLETKSNPWGQNAKDRLNWIGEVDFDVPVFGVDADSFDGYEYLFWVGCAGAFEDRAKKTTKAVAELLAIAGVKYMVLGAEETCNGDSARRSGNEFLFQQLAQQAVETLNGVFEGVETVDRKIVVTCPHCFNTIGREYKQLGANYTVLHHTQLLNRLVRDKKLVPVAPVSQDVTYHDPCYLGRHNKVYEAPRELVGASGAVLKEMPRHAETGLCCGAGGARMWMEEHIGKRVNHERVDEALTTVSDGAKIATACPFCRVMMTDGLTDRQDEGKGEGVEVLDVAQLLLAAIDTGTVTLPPKKKPEKEPEKPAAAAPAAAPAPAAGPSAPAAAETAQTEAKPVTGLGMAGGAKRPGAKKAAPAAPAPAPRRSRSPSPRGSGSAQAGRGCTREGPRHGRRRQTARREKVHSPCGTHPSRAGTCSGTIGIHCRRSAREGTRHRSGRQTARRQKVHSPCRTHPSRAGTCSTATGIDRRNARVRRRRRRRRAHSAGQRPWHRARCSATRQAVTAEPARCIQLRQESSKRPAAWCSQLAATPEMRTRGHSRNRSVDDRTLCQDATRAAFPLQPGSGQRGRVRDTAGLRTRPLSRVPERARFIPGRRPTSCALLRPSWPHQALPAS